MPADTFGIPVLDSSKEPAPAICKSEDLGAVSTPHDIRGCCNNLAGMQLGLSLESPVGRQQLVLPHDAQHTLTTNLDPLDKA